MPEPKYYVVWKGRKTGVFTSWHECEKQVNGFNSAQYKAFKNRAEAEQAFRNDPQRISPDIIKKSLSVDAACSGNPGLLEYRGVDTSTRTEIFKRGPFENGTNNIGEFLAVVHALAYLKKQKSKIPVYSDSVTALSWVKNKRVKTELQKDERNKKLFEMMDRALQWLEENKYENKILKWDTEIWGENPADFGRK